MKTFSMSAAVAEPFRLAFKRPLMTIVWGLVLLLPVAAALGGMIPLFSEMMESGVFDADAVAEAADPELMPGDFAAMMQFQLWNALSNLLQMVTLVLITTAAIRAVFAGRRGDAAAYLRIGKDEFHVAVIGLAIFVGMMVAVIVLLLLGVGIAFGLAQLGDPWRWVIGIGLFLAAWLSLLLVWGRLSLLAPAAIRYRSFAFDEGWKLGRGQSWKLLGMMLVLIVVTLCLMLAVMFLLFVVIAAVGGGFAAFGEMHDEAAFEAWFAGLAERRWPLIAAGVALLIPFAWFQGLSQLLFTAPYARVVMDLAAEPAPISTDAPAASE